MTDDRMRALEALLAQTEAAHGAYEATELNGVYDEQWPEWYAEYAVEHGIGAVLGTEITAEELAHLFESGWQEFQSAEPAPAEPWGAFIARQLVDRA